MLLAHSGEVAGFHFESLLYATGLAVLAVVLFVRKDVSRFVPLALVVVAVALLATACQSETTKTDVSIALVNPADGDTIPAGEPVTLEVDLEGGELATGHAEHGGDGGGHIHVLIDGKTATMSDSLTPVVTFEPGEHTLTVEYVDGEHESFSPPVKDEARVTAE